MGRVQLAEADAFLIDLLQQLRDEAGWTIRREAAALGLHLETLRGVLFSKNRAGPRILYALLAYIDLVEARRDGDTPAVINDLRDCVLSLWQRHRPRLLDRLWRRVAHDFDSNEALVGFLRVDRAEWEHFSRGNNPSQSLLRAISAAYRDEAQLKCEDAEEARWCLDTAEFADLVLRLLPGGGAKE